MCAISHQQPSAISATAAVVVVVAAVEKSVLHTYLSTHHQRHRGRRLRRRSSGEECAAHLHVHVCVLIYGRRQKTERVHHVCVSLRLNMQLYAYDL